MAFATGCLLYVETPYCCYTNHVSNCVLLLYNWEYSHKFLVGHHFAGLNKPQYSWHCITPRITCINILLGCATTKAVCPIFIGLMWYQDAQMKGSAIEWTTGLLCTEGFSSYLTSESRTSTMQSNDDRSVASPASTAIRGAASTVLNCPGFQTLHFTPKVPATQGCTKAISE